MRSSEKELTYKAFMNREYEFRHSPYEKEFEFYECVKSGDTEKVKSLMTPLGAEGSGQLSEDPLRNLKYHFIVTIALMTRFCVEGGLGMEKAYTLSDLYILKADKCRTAEELHAVHREAVLDFTEQMSRTVKGNIYSKPVVMAMDYIYDHLHSKIYEEDIAEYVHLSGAYLSRLFHKEVGLTISTYISVKRVETAKNMLRFSDYPPVDIGSYLAFNSHSHFIMTFKRYTGMTPNEYRRRYYRSNWSKDSTDKSE